MRRDSEKIVDVTMPRQEDGGGQSYPRLTLYALGSADLTIGHF